MPLLWFVVPAHGRVELARICLKQLRWTCDALTDEGITASAIVIACDENLDTAREFGFGTIERNNLFLSRRFNDGIQLACDPEINPRPVDYVVPCGSDNWVDHRLFLELPPSDTMYGFHRLSFVRPDGEEISLTTLRDHGGGCGIRIYPRQVMERAGFRPADEDRYRGCDTSTLVNLQRAFNSLQVIHRESDPRQIVDWKSPTEQVTSYESIVARHRPEMQPDPFGILADVFPAEALDEMVVHYGRVLVSA